MREESKLEYGKEYVKNKKRKRKTREQAKNKKKGQKGTKRDLRGMFVEKRLSDKTKKKTLLPTPTKILYYY